MELKKETLLIVCTKILRNNGPTHLKTGIKIWSFISMICHSTAYCFLWHFAIFENNSKNEIICNQNKHNILSFQFYYLN